jgi:hypothetical protein
MAKSYLLVHEVSYRYITALVDYISAQLQKHSPLATEIHLCKSVEDVSLEPNSIVYIIGDPFKKFAKVKSCKYVFLNFSVLYVLGNPLKCSFAAYKLIRKKRKIFEDKVACYDYVLDFWAEQTEVMQAKVSVPVKTFPVSINLRGELSETSTRKYDVCFVGGVTPRRAKVIKKLQELGISVSPTEGVVFEDMATQSKIVLNLRARRSNHLELPRIVGAFATKAALVTEHDPALEGFCPTEIYVSAKYGDLVDQILSLLQDSDRLNDVANKAYSWMANNHAVLSDMEWQNRILEIHAKFHEPTFRNS